MNEWRTTMSCCSMTSKVNKNCDTKTPEEDPSPSMAALLGHNSADKSFSMSTYWYKDSSKTKPGPIRERPVFTPSMSVPPWKLQSPVGLVLSLLCHSSSILTCFHRCFFYCSICALEIIPDGLQCNQKLFSSGQIYLMARGKCLLTDQMLYCICLHRTGSQKQLQKTGLYFLVNVYFHYVTTNTFLKIYVRSFILGEKLTEKLS